jgi:uncharacterized repeat protein (TIGR03803 family)
MGRRWTESILYSFAERDEAFPVEGLIMDAAGNLYGTLSVSGAVFELSPSGGGWTERLIYSFDNTVLAGLTMDSSGNIFGVTSQFAFELSPDGNGSWNPTVIHRFRDGVEPNGTLVLDKAGNLYGTTHAGGSKNAGTIYELIRQKQGEWIGRTLYLFKDGRDGRSPIGIVFDAAGNIYGATTFGGEIGHISSDGTIFELVPVGNGRYREKVLWTFNNRYGRTPVANVILDDAGNLYGTADGGGSGGYGVVFEVTP